MWDDSSMLNETQNQFSLIRAARSTSGRAKSKFLSVITVAKFLLLLVVATILVAGCGKSASSGADSSSPKVATTPSNPYLGIWYYVPENASPRGVVYRSLEFLDGGKVAIVLLDNDPTERFAIHGPIVQNMCSYSVVGPGRLTLTEPDNTTIIYTSSVTDGKLNLAAQDGTGQTQTFRRLKPGETVQSLASAELAAQRKR
jgi:hypothetical protein